MAGLIISTEEFSKLPQKQQLKCLYENQVETLCTIKSYKLHQKIQYPWLFALTMSAIYIIKQLTKIL